MKYLVANLEGNEAIFVFPRAIDHDRMAEALSAIRFGDSHNWERKLHNALDDGKIVSAGFIDERGECFGSSETLGLKSRGAADSALLKARGGAA